MIPCLVARHQVTGGTRGRRRRGRTFGAGGLQRGQRTVRGRVLQRCAGRVAIPLVLAQPGAEREPTGILFEPEWRVAFGPALGAVRHEHRRHKQRQDLLADRGRGDIRLRKQRGEPVERGNGIAAEDGADAKVDRKRVTIRDQCLQHVAGSRVVHRQQRVARAVAHRRQRAIPPKLRQQRDGRRIAQRAECPHAVFPWAIDGAYASHRVVGCVVKLPAFFFRQARPVGNGVGGTFGKIRREERGRAQLREDFFSFLMHRMRSCQSKERTFSYRRSKTEARQFRGARLVWHLLRVVQGILQSENAIARGGLERLAPLFRITKSRPDRVRVTSEDDPQSRSNRCRRSSPSLPTIVGIPRNALCDKARASRPISHEKVDSPLPPRFPMPRLPTLI